MAKTTKPSSFIVLTASKVVEKWREGTFSKDRQAVFFSFSWGGWGVNPQVINS